MNLVIHLYGSPSEFNRNIPELVSGTECVWNPCALDSLFKRDKVTSISGKIFPGFKHNPKKIETLFEMVRLHDHHNIPSVAFYNSCKPILTGLELEYLVELIQNYRAKKLDELIQKHRMKKAAKLAEEMEAAAKEIQAQTNSQKYIVTNDAFKEMFEAYAAEALKKEIDQHILSEIYGKQKTDSAG